MGLYSRVHLAELEECPRCHSMIDRVVQFKYGNTRLIEHRIGEALQWGGNDVGEKGHRWVRIGGYPEPCPVCGDLLALPSEVLYEVTIEHDRLVAVLPIGTADQEIALFGPTGCRIEDD